MTQAEENLQLPQCIAVAASDTRSSPARAGTNDGTALNWLLNKPQPTRSGRGCNITAMFRILALPRNIQPLPQEFAAAQRLDFISYSLNDARIDVSRPPLPPPPPPPCTSGPPCSTPARTCSHIWLYLAVDFKNLLVHHCEVLLCAS